MLRSLKQLYGNRLDASDGEIGHAKDFYFNDRDWAVRYIVADTGAWLQGRLVLISPHAFGNCYQDGDCLPVNLTRKQIESSPAIEAHKPVSRQFEEAYYRHYGWPFYWEAGGMWGIGGFPSASPHLPPSQEATQNNTPDNGDEPNLRSTRALTGYHIQTADGAIGHVVDFIIDDKKWVIRHLVVETGHWFSGKEIVTPPMQVHRIDGDESTVFVSANKEAILRTPEYYASPLGGTFQNSRDFDL